jgi:hypothetical protein
VKERAVAKRCGLFLASPRTVIALRGRRISGARGLTRGKVCELTGSPLRLQPELDQAPDGCGAAWRLFLFFNPAVHTLPKIER